jgi:hypothetical protein
VVALVLVETSALTEALVVLVAVVLVGQAVMVQVGREVQVLQAKALVEEQVVTAEVVVQHVEVAVQAVAQVVLETSGQLMLLLLDLQEESVLHLTFLVLA